VEDGIDRASIAGLAPEALRALLPAYLAQFVADPDAAARNRERVGAEIAAWSDQTCRDVVARISTLGDDHQPYPAVPACRALSRVWTRDVVLDPSLDGVDHLRAAVERGPTLLVCNHLSYFDTTATDAILAWAGHADLADRLVAAAGPKVYQHLFRLLAATCLNTLPVPQSTSLAHTEKLSQRELARRAIESVEAAKLLLEGGDLLLLYPEGSRSRTGQLGPFLRGVQRYVGCTHPLSVVPVAIVGTEQVMPVADPRLHPGPVSLRFAEPIATEPGANGAREALAHAHRAVQRLLPLHLRPLAIAAETA
jgi:1-acyl-sn-glycerol-3-phosphate acyltransferase